MRCVSGLVYQYYFICKRKTWLCMHGISMENDNDNVKIGKLIDEDSYKRELKHVLINDTANIDYIRDHTVYEIKKSKAEKPAAIAQIKYYLFVLKQNGIKCSGELQIPKENYTERVYLSETDENEIKDTIQTILECENQEIPSVINKKICKKCSFYELCYI